jgi:hypothetical protein
MQQSGDTRRNQRMHPAQRPELDKTGRHLRRANQGGGNRARCAGAGEYGAAEFITKPVDFDFLKTQLRDLSDAAD